MEIFIIREGRQTGPFNEDAVRAFLTEGTARPADMGWRKGMAEWRPLGEVLQTQRVQTEQAAQPVEREEPNTAAPVSPAPEPPAGAGDAEEKFVAATAKQKAFLKYLGAEFGENLTKERAAIAVSDALETPKLQPRIRKWHDDKLRMHAEVFQDEIDFRKANRTTRYLERIQTEGADVLKDVTKAHVQVLVESLDKRHPGWEAEPESALWNHLLPAIGEHFPQLVQPAHKGLLKSGSAVRSGSSISRGIGATAGVVPPAQPTGTFGAMVRGVAFGVIALGLIVIGLQYWQKSHEKVAAQTPPLPEKKETSSVTPAASLPGNLIAEAKEPAAPAENPAAPVPTPSATEPAPAPAAPTEPPAPMNAAKPEATIPTVPTEEKPAVPAPAPAVPAMAPEAPAAPVVAAPPVVAPPVAAPPRTAVKLTQGIGVMLANGQVTLPAGTVLRYVATEGANVRVSWNNNVFFVPAAATDVNEPVPALSEPAATPPAPGTPPAAPASAAATKPKKPADDL